MCPRPVNSARRTGLARSRFTWRAGRIGPTTNTVIPRSQTSAGWMRIAKLDARRSCSPDRRRSQVESGSKNVIGGVRRDVDNALQKQGAVMTTAPAEQVIHPEGIVYAS